MSPESVNDPREMRKTLTRMRYTGNSDFKGARDGYSTAANLAHHILTAAEYQGMSGEDAYTMLAYHALIQLEEARGILLERVMFDPSPRFATAIRQDGEPS